MVAANHCDVITVAMWTEIESGREIGTESGSGGEGDTPPPLELGVRADRGMYQGVAAQRHQLEDKVPLHEKESDTPLRRGRERDSLHRRETESANQLRLDRDQ